MNDSSLRPSGRYYGWTVVWAILFVLTVSSGLGFYNHSVVLNALSRNPDLPVEAASWAVSLFFVSTGVAGLWLGRLLQHTDPRWCITGGAILSAGALASLAWVDSLLKLYIVYVIFGAGFAAAGLLPCTTLVTRWFQRRRATAMSIATTGMSLGGVVITPASAALVNRFGFENVAPFMGLAYLITVIPVTWLFMKPAPSQPDSGKPSAPGAVTPPAPGLPYALAMRHRFFWGLTLAYVFLLMAQVSGISHQFGLVNEVIGLESAAVAVAIVPVTSIVFRLLGGWLLTFVPLWGFSLAVMLLQFVSLVVLSLASGQWVLFVGLALFGASVGNLLVLQSLLVAEAFGLRDYSRIVSVSSLLLSLGAAAGPGILGLVYAMLGSYSWAYGWAALAGLTGVLCFAAAGPIPLLRAEHIAGTDVAEQDEPESAIAG